MLDINDIVKIFEEIELRLVQSLKRNLGRHRQEEQDYGMNWSAWQAEKLEGLRKFRQENADIMSQYVDQIDTETRKIMAEQFEEGMNGAVPHGAEQPQFFGVDTVKVNKLIDDVSYLEKNVETAALRCTDDVYRRTVHRAQLAMSTGSMTLQQAIDMAVKDFLDKGINCIVYRDGRRVNIADYVRMALRTTATRAALQGKSERFKALGYDTIQVSKYSMCSDTCLPWQGRIYINDVYTMWDGEVRDHGGILWGKSNYCGKWFMLLSAAIEKGLFHPNCRHTILLWRDGDPLPESIDNEENERRYKLEQEQRRLENKVRKAKRKVEGLSDPDNIKKAKAELREAQKQLREFIEKVNADEGETILKRDYGKEKIYLNAVNKNEISDDIMESRFTENLDDLNNGQKDVIKHRNIELELEKSEIGREYKQYLMDNPCRVNIYYNVDVDSNHLGEYDSFSDTISLFGSNTKTVAKTSEVLIHELTHRRYNIYGDFWSECVCRSHEIMHRERRSYLTIQEKRSIIKEIKEVYSELHPDWKWRRRS